MEEVDLWETGLEVYDLVPRPVLYLLSSRPSDQVWPSLPSAYPDMTVWDLISSQQ